tara:strand:+ start:253 stop:750 length:498 start_codon:yes stop_codon:yes gene_type:complete
MSEQQIDANRLLVNRFYHEFFNKNQFGIAEELLAEEITFHGALGKQTQGIDQLINYIKEIKNTFPDLQCSVEDLIAEEQKVAACLTYKGTHEGTFFGIEPQGSAVNFVGVCIFIVRADLITHAWELGDRLTVFQQLTQPELDEGILDMDGPPKSSGGTKVPEWNE